MRNLESSIAFPCYSLFLLIFLLPSCSAQEKPNLSKDNQPSYASPFERNAAPESQIAEYIRHVFQDQNGHLWLGTNGYGLAYFDGDSLSYFSTAEGFAGEQITGITEDPEKNLWFATNLGLVKYDGTLDEQGNKIFTNYSNEKYFNGRNFWSIFADSKGMIWAGTGERVYRFDGTNWKVFELPYSEEDEVRSLLTNVTIWTITEDQKGNIWFGTNGNGAIQYDGKSFVQYTKKDGLADNSVDPIIEDSKGNIWLGTRHGGVSVFNGQTFTNYTSRDSIGNDEVCIIFEDRKGNIWLSSEGYGVYKYDGEKFTNFFRDQGLGVQAVQTIYEDREGRLWVGGGGGLYRLDGKSFIHVTKNGPWK